MAVVCLPGNLTVTWCLPGKLRHQADVIIITHSHTITHTHQLNLNFRFVLQQKIYKTPHELLSIKREICVWHLCCNDCTVYPVIKVFVWCDHRVGVGGWWGRGYCYSTPHLLVSTCQSICRLVTPLTETVHGDSQDLIPCHFTPPRLLYPHPPHPTPPHPTPHVPYHMPCLKLWF